MGSKSSQHVRDHLLRPYRLSTRDALEHHGLVENAGLLRRGSKVQSRRERDRALGTGLRTDPALHAFRFDEAQLRGLRVVENRALGTGADAGEAHRARIAI